MAGETSNISQMANLVAEEVFKTFRWSWFDLTDENFDCRKPSSHSKKQDGHTHPVDVVFYYNDPYLNRMVYLNTDLKSYKKDSIKQSNVRSALRSLAHTIDCARVSPQWKQRYAPNEAGSPDVRGMLFVYNHDGEYDQRFYSHINPGDSEQSARSLNTDSLPTQNKQYLHIVEPKLINYLTTIVNDMQRLHHKGEFPEKDYAFFYPELRLHKTHGDAYSRAATIEMLTAPYLIIKHKGVRKFDETSGQVKDSHPPGCVIYYNRPGEDHREFMYFFDMLSNFQILDGGEPIKLRVACFDRDKEILANYQKAINAYSQAWGFDDYKRGLLERIDLHLIETWSKSFNSTDIGWRV